MGGGIVGNFYPPAGGPISLPAGRQVISKQFIKNMSVEKWEEISREEIFSKWGRSVNLVKFRLPNGKEMDFNLKKEGPYVCALALTKDKKVILAKQFRPGPKEVLMELPGGGVEKNETPEQAIEREILEETGYKGKIQFIGKSHDDAYLELDRSCFVVTDCEKVSEIKGDDTEFIELVVLSLEEFRQLLRSGKMTDIEVGYMGLDFLGLL